MSSSAQKIGYPFMESKICETGWCHLQSLDQMPDHGDAFPWGAGHGTLRWTHASEQAGKALRSQGHQCVVM